MSESTSNRRPRTVHTLTRQSGSASRLRPAVSELLDTLAEGLEGHRLGNTVIVETAHCPCRIVAQPVWTPTPDGAVVAETVTVMTDIDPAASLPKHTEGHVNRFAALSAVVRELDTDALRLVSRVSLYEGWEQSLPLYWALLFAAACLHDEGLIAAAEALFPPEGVGVCPPKDIGGDVAARGWRVEDWEGLQAALQEREMAVSVGAHGLAASLPWRWCGLSATDAEEAAFLSFRADMPHLRLGLGLFFSLELPTVFSKSGAAELANWLNLLEWEELDAPPFLGAWCLQLCDTRLAFVGFWPNRLYRPDALFHITAWMEARTERVRGYLENLLQVTKAQ